MGRPVSLFISDLHLCPSRPAIAALFRHFLREHAPQADALYILGDLFEYWAGDDDLEDPFNAQICHALRACATTTPIHLLVGNRDFLIGHDFAAASQITLLEEPTLLRLAGIPTLLTHGDTLCTDDTAYQNFRAVVRTPAWRDEFLSRPLIERKNQIETLRRRSEQEKQTKTAQLMDVNPDAVAAALRQHDYPRLIHGHTHRPGKHIHPIDGHPCERWVLGEWRDNGNYLILDNTGCRFQELPLQE
jgi:UDP-2,3-diacylglucosamine hydrolase